MVTTMVTIMVTSPKDKSLRYPVVTPRSGMNHAIGVFVGRPNFKTGHNPQHTFPDGSA